MTHEKAVEIATQFMERMNPERWDGKGEQPSSFDERIYEEPISNNVTIEITLIADNYGDDEEWSHQTCVELVDNNGNPYGAFARVNELNNVDAIADIIEYLFKRHVKNGVVVAR